MRLKKRWIILILIGISMITCSIPEIIHENSGVSESVGSVRNGKLNNGWLMPYKGSNYRYFSPFSYYILNNGYVHSSVHAALTNAYAECESTCPGIEFRLMECTRKKGGRMLLHWTHQNGMSADFMVPKIRKNDHHVWSNHAGLCHYLFQFDHHGRFFLGKKTEIDFETIARHIIALDKAALKNGLRIRKILFNEHLQDELFNSPSGKELAARDINIIPHLNDLINRFHDDHYHVDFEVVSSEW